MALAQLSPNGATASFRGSLPPKAIAAPEAADLTTLHSRLTSLTADFQSLRQHARAADVEVFLKAVRYALDLGEWYDKKPADNLKKANALLDEATTRMAGLKKNKTPWLDGAGQKVLGFYSQIDDSAQPYGVEIPEGLVSGEGKPAVPMWIWLHGRGDTATDLNFVYSRLMAKKPGQFQPAGTIVIHPFGRYCNGWKSAGETDVFECRDDAMKRFNVDQNRVALAGFSMGGAGAWHLGAHFPGEWACVHAGAGFVDVKRYQKLTLDKFPANYEQKLWGAYDVPDYARNFFNVPLVIYSGENDSQRDAATYMTEILAKEGLVPPHLIGPGMGHQYYPEVIKQVQAKVESAVAKGRDTTPTKVSLQIKTLAYSQAHWLRIEGMKTQWEEARADAEWDEAKNEIRVRTRNVTGLTVQLPKANTRVLVDGVEKPNQVPTIGSPVWAWRAPQGEGRRSNPKRPGLQGPIDDAFKSRFVIVLPDGEFTDSAVDQWVKAESAHFIQRWRSLMRGDPVVKKASEIIDRDAEDAHLILWGTPVNNSMLAKMLPSKTLGSVLKWNKDTITLGQTSYPAQTHVPVLCHPNPLRPHRYVVINSGLTFREAHDRTNSLQNPKLPDWAILDITQPPSAESAGKIVAAGFFDEVWQFKK